MIIDQYFYLNIFAGPFVRGRSSSERRRSVRDPASPAPSAARTSATATPARPSTAGPVASTSSAVSPREQQLQAQANKQSSKKDLLSSTVNFDYFDLSLSKAFFS